VHIADECRSSPSPRLWEVSEPDSCSRDTRPVCIEKTIESGYDRGAEKQFNHAMEVHRQSSQPHDSKDNPTRNRSQDKKTDQPNPNSSNLVKCAHSGIGIAKGEE
jgi:hypothetical protein